MSLDHSLIRSIHRLLKQQSDLRERLEFGPRKLRLLRSNEANFLVQWEEAKELVRKTHMAVDARQLQLDEREAKIEQMKVQLNTCETNKEFQLLKDRIAADLQANSVLQDEIFEMLERLDEAKEAVQQAKLNYEKSQADSIRMEEEVKTETKTLSAELGRVSADLADRERKLPGNILQEYRHAIKGLAEDVLGETDGQSCGNCNQALTKQMAADVRASRVVYCQGCACLLYPNDVAECERGP